MRDVGDILETLEEGGVGFLLDAETPPITTPDSQDILFNIDNTTTNKSPANENKTASPSLTMSTMTESQQKIYEALDGEPVELDELSSRTGLDISRLQADVTILQIRGLIARTTASGISRSRR